MIAFLGVGIRSTTAEPIALSYRVTVTHRADIQTRTPVEIAPIKFHLSVLFDSAVTDRFVIKSDDPDDLPFTGELRTLFGDPHISGVPTELGVLPDTAGGFAHSIERRFGDWSRADWTSSSAELYAARNRRVRQTNFSTWTSLWDTSNETVTGNATARSFLALLTHPHFFHEYSAFDLREERYLPQSVRYEGFATLDSGAAVAEPSTAILVVSGLAAAAFRRRSAIARR